MAITYTAVLGVPMNWIDSQLDHSQGKPAPARSAQTAPTAGR
jgi:hypothetical protein